jgi:hypothetical protein
MKVQLSLNPDVLGKIQVQGRNQQHKIYQKQLSVAHGKGCVVIDLKSNHNLHL